MLLRLSTSISDTRAFPARAAAAAQDDALFASFKRDPEFRVVIENLTCEHGRHYLDTALRQTPWLAGQLDRFRENDRIGSPQVCDYGDLGSFSPTTLRYVKVLSDLSRLFGSLEGARIVEIGGGYGGQCHVISAAARPGSYTLVDLEPVLMLQRRYLKELGVPEVRFATADELEPARDYDLVISNYAFSECTRPVQQRYIEQILARSARGYITCNWFLGRLVSMTPAELLAAVPGARYADDGPRASIMLWGADELSDAREQPVDLEESAGSRIGKAGLEPQ
jgi:predicted O-methyltransferase YrrM